MQTPITFLSAEASSNSAKQNKSTPTQPVGNSFKQVLTKEISNKQNTSPATSANKIENNASAKQPQAAVEQTTANNKQIKKEEESDTEAIPKVNDQADNAQLIAFVENLAQLPLKIQPTSSGSADDKIQLDGASQLLQNSEKKDPSLNLASVPTLIANEMASAVPNLKDRAEIKIDKALISKDTPASLIGDSTDKKAKGLAASLTDQDDKRSAMTYLEKHPDTIQATSDRMKDAQLQTAKLTEDLTSNLTSVTPAAQNFAQQFAISANQINTSDAPVHLTPHVGTAAWDQAVGQKVVWMVAGGQQTAELTLNPPDLGPLQVIISVNNDQANASFFSAQPEVRDALESALPKLRQMMSDAGVQLSGFSVNSQSSNQGSQFSGERPTTRTQNNSNEKNGDSSSPALVSTSIIKTKEGLVDTFV
ncbi:MAG: flagellar hook-length control protein FliK [Undibacterium sp.]|uniref:flagellar hook-length control protein FliK n=1 Tax=Undibacterium sp. TaxID=1914977 RepID=UPI0027211E48|nr:flagellar hook-length control protein FliK [Undibacterium sp.]MDO8651609.1 flagellar hook-length control protein FliK [Undibacterium sp.]